MPKVIPVGAAEVAIGYKNASDSEVYYLTFGVTFDGVADAADYLNGFDDFTLQLTPHWSSVYNFITWDVAFQDDAENQTLFSGTMSNPGAVNTAIDKQNVAYLIHKNTALGGRSGKGRFYLSGVINTYASDGGVLQATPLSNWNTDVADALAALEAAGFTMVLFHDVPETDSQYGEATVVTSLTVDPILATQRRRLRR